jgi:hypothetical protein
MLVLILGSQFHLWVLGSGIVLLGMAAIRAVTLWQSAGKSRSPHDHDHDHEHDSGYAHNHEHAHCSHDHGHEHHHHDEGVPCPENGHHHNHGHAHDHHAHADHDHDWAPWRYVLLLVPIMLFLLGLPNKGPQIHASNTQVDMSHESAAYAGLIANAAHPLQQLAMSAALAAEESSGPAITLDFKTLEQAAETERFRRDWKGKRVKIKGQFAPSANDRVFSLVRFRIRCCAADAVQLNVPMICKESVNDTKTGPEQWVDVTGQIDFQKRGNFYQTILLVPNRNAIAPSQPDANPWAS